MHRKGLVVVALALFTAACGGGGGQLAERSSKSTTTAATDRGVDPIPVDALEAPRTAKATARSLERVEAGLRVDNRDAPRLRALGREQQLAYRQLAAHPQWVDNVIAALPSALRPGVQANVDAGAALSALGGEAPSGFPPWVIAEPPPAETLRGYYDEAEVASGISWAYLAAIHLVETRMGRIRGTSTAGAQGPMQFIQATWDSYGEGDINDNRDAILAAGRYLDASGGPENMGRALFSYNNDERYVAAVQAYANVMLADPREYDGYYNWQVFYGNVDGTFLLPEGFTSPSA